ncbi:hypothetical protein [Paraclostridium bifermentans]|uniref:hypothetical protein n=1 Tax=Paraclostridium bifermentans TaxID=1490 RepID=UPI00189767BE|nr:hypothetical protein [Paraclostridium bifermentans]
MKQKLIILITTILLALNFWYFISFMDSFTIIKFILIVIILPCILCSTLLAACLYKGDKGKSKYLKYVVGTGIYTIIFALILNNLSSKLEKIVDNTTKMNNTNFTISNITLQNNISSYVFVFLIIFVLAILFDLVFNKLIGGDKNVY